MAKAIVLEKPICKIVDDDYTGKEKEFLIANEALAFSVAMSIIKAYIKLKLEKQGLEIYIKELQEQLKLAEAVYTVAVDCGDFNIKSNGKGCDDYDCLEFKRL